jgi:SAM-dependent methyltransferase
MNGGLPRIAPAWSAFIVRKARKAARAVIDKTYRHELLARHGFIHGSFQSAGVTCEDRYPEIFQNAQSILGRNNEGRMLSFGCATGEEVFTLREYFPYARIRGIDINPGRIDQARRRLAEEPDARLAFEVANSTSEEADGSYDAIFCMAVLRDGRLRLSDTRCDTHIRFALFASVIADFERCLSPGGLLVVRHNNFFVGDTPAAAALDCVFTLPMRPRTPVFGPDDRIIPGATNPEAVFRKLPIPTTSMPPGFISPRMAASSPEGPLR